MTSPHGMNSTSASAGDVPVANSAEAPCQVCGAFDECDELAHVRRVAVRPVDALDMSKLAGWPLSRLTALRM